MEGVNMKLLLIFVAILITSIYQEERQYVDKPDHIATFTQETTKWGGYHFPDINKPESSAYFNKRSERHEVNFRDSMNIRD